MYGTRLYDIIISGGAASHNPRLVDWDEATEAEHFDTVMQQAGVTQNILLDKESVNTGQNVTNSYQLLKSHGNALASIVIVTKPYMERRALATFDVQWPNDSTERWVTSIGGSMRDYYDDTQLLEKMIPSMVGDLQRIIEYPSRGWQSPQLVPDGVKIAYSKLVDAGFIRRLSKN